jgi:putative ABC transport system substrate-binding protein
VKRRKVITLLGGVAAWPLAARAQQPERIRRIGVLSGLVESDPETPLRDEATADRIANLQKHRVVAFRQALGKLGWSEGRNLVPSDPRTSSRCHRPPIGDRASRLSN